MGIDQYLLVIWSFLGTLAAVAKASENLALGKATDQSSTYGSYDSSKAVDNCTQQLVGSGCCSHTAIGRQEAWWQVDLQTQSVINTVGIIYRDEGDFLKRLAGYEIYLSNTSDWASGTRCHKDDTPNLASMSATQNVQCPGVARYLTIYNDRRVKEKPWYSTNAILELCEVNVMGCPIGKYGTGNCNNNCFNCLGDICDPSSGTCDACASGYYKSGTVCHLCPANCLGNTCHDGAGACSDCNDGYYGPSCTQCSSGCSGNTCDKNTGQCSDCNDEFYGPTCTACPSGCSGNSCDKTSGYCIECVAGFYGNNCNQPCSAKCESNLCIQRNGFCTRCVPGFYGNTCDQRCSVNCKDSVCNQGNGLCTNCISGYHGNLCEKNCPSNCKDNTCTKASGMCLGCEPGHHGSNCSLSCPENCKDRTCIQDNGQCIECRPGFHGTNCVDMCGYCQDGRCDRVTGICVTSCIEGLTGHKCGVKDVRSPNKAEDINVTAIGIGTGCGVVIVVLIIVIIVLVRRQQSMTQQNTTRSTTMTDISLPNVGQDQQAEKDGTYEIIEAETIEESGMNKSTTDSGYEQLGERAKDVPHIYDTT